MAEPIRPRVFISYARATAAEANLVGEALRALGYSVWRDDQLPAHRTYADGVSARFQGSRWNLEPRHK